MWQRFEGFPDISTASASTQSAAATVAFAGAAGPVCAVEAVESNCTASLIGVPARSNACCWISRH
jgi:hypothetical protein